MVRFRRKSRVTWLPSINTNVVSAAGTQSHFYFDNGTISNLNYERSSQMYTLIPDYPASAIRASAPNIPSLGDWEGSAYLLRRIVGKAVISVNNTPPPDPQAQTYPALAAITLCFMICRVDEATGAPLRAADGYSPQALNNVQDPFIWRRTWVLQNDFASSAALAGRYQYPRCNADYGSIQDGPHIDAKTRRRVADEERVIAILSSTNLSGDSTLAGGYDILLDLRLLASPLRIAGNRRNASR